MRIKARCRMVSVTGDDAVREAVVQGPHRVHREADTLVIEDDEDEAHHGPAFHFSRGFGHRFVMGNRDAPPLVVRMRPGLDLDVEMDAGSIAVRHVRGAVQVQLSAGAVRVEGFRAPLDIDVAAGSIWARGRPTAGQSRVECGAGKVHIDLEPGSSVEVQTKVELGRARLPGVGEADSSSWLGSRSSAVVGQGAGRLDIVVGMGKVFVGES